MNNGNRDKKHSGAGTMILQVLPRALGLGFRIGIFYLGFKRRARKAGKIFEKELLAAGMDKIQARQLRDDYLQTSHVIRHMRKSASKW
jgi:hypothetical protein